LERSPPQRKRLRISNRARRDLFWLALSTIAFWIVSLRIDLAEHFAGFLEHLSVGHEHSVFELDEMLLTLAFSALGLALFSWRRWHDLHFESEIREQAEENLIRRQERLQRIVDQIPVMIAFIGPDGSTEWINPEWERVLGWSLNEVRQHNPLQAMYPDAEVRSEVVRFAMAGTREWKEFTTRTRDGKELSTVWSNVVLSDGSSIGFGQDVTWRKRSEEALRESERKYHSLYTSMREGVAILEPILGADGKLVDYVFADVNPAFKAHTGLEAERVRGRRSGEIWQKPLFLDVFNRVLATGRSEEFQRYFEPLDRYFAVSAFSLGENRFATLITDITERQRTTLALERYGQRLELLYDLSREVATTLDPREVASRAVETLRSVTGATRGVVVLFDQTFRRAEVLATSGETDAPAAAVAAAIERLPGFGAIGWVARNRKAILMDDVRDDPRWTIVEGIGEKTRSFLGVPLLVGERLLGVLALVSDRPEDFLREQLRLVQSAAATVAVAIANSRLFEAAEHHRQQLQVLSVRLAEAEEAERRRVSQDLHDVVGQALTVLAINLNLAFKSTETEDVTATRERLADSLLQVEEIMDRVREVISELRPPLLDEQGLASTLHWYAQQFEARTGIDTRVSGSELETPLDTTVRTALFRIGQEALTNAAKHAAPSLVRLELRAIDGHVRLTVSDDGTGFDPDARPSREPGHGLGLLDMRERAESVNGTFLIESTPGTGTRVIVEVPH